VSGRVALGLALLLVLPACSRERAGSAESEVTIEQVEREAFGPVEEPLFPDYGGCLGLDAPVALGLLGVRGGSANPQAGEPEPGCVLQNAQAQTVATLTRLPTGAAAAEALLRLPGERLASGAGDDPVTLHLHGWTEAPIGEGLLAGPDGLLLARFEGVSRQQAEQFLRLQGVRALGPPPATAE